MRNRMISYVNKVLAESDNLAPVRVSLCHDSGVADNVRWKNMTLKAQQEVFQSVLEHFRNHGYSVRSLGQDDVIEIGHNYPEIHSKDKIAAITNQAIADKMKNDIPAAITMAINLVNTKIEQKAKNGCFRCEINLQENATYPKSLTWKDKVSVYQHVFEMLKSEGYYVHNMVNYRRATVIWGEEAEKEWQIHNNPIPEPVQKKKGLFSRKKKGA